MKKTAIEQLLNNFDITEAKVVISISRPDGSRKNGIVLKAPEDFMNDLVEKDTKVNLVFANAKIYTGFFDSLEDEDGEYVLYIHPEKDSKWGECLPYDKLVGYYLEDAV